MHQVSFLSGDIPGGKVHERSRQLVANPGAAGASCDSSLLLLRSVSMPNNLLTHSTTTLPPVRVNRKVVRWPRSSSPTSTCVRVQSLPGWCWHTQVPSTTTSDCQLRGTTQNPGQLSSQQPRMVSALSLSGTGRRLHSLWPSPGQPTNCHHYPCKTSQVPGSTVWVEG